MRLLIVEDLPDTSAWLAAAATSALEDVSIDCVFDLAGARKRLEGAPPDVALVDLGLPDGSGTDLLRELAAIAPECLRIVTTIYDDDSHLFAALKAGAQGYLLKSQSETALVAALRGIVAGELPLTPKIARRILGSFWEPPKSTHAQDDLHLTSRETETLQLITKGYRLAEVAACMKISRNTAATFVKSIYRKLHVSSRAEAALEAARRGLVKQEP